MKMKNGFSTINRLLGKHKESNNNLSRSTTNLSVTKSTVNINDSSQVHQNRITPLLIATSNAPFEQTFRITVLLPRDQLYVARLGAKVLLHKLLQLVCENKQLDPEKYEFRHPADPSQIYSCDLTIGAVGLSEIRLCNKSQYNDTYQSDDVTSRRNSFSSSKFSRYSKNISSTPSLYSSRNSLNSMSSSGMDSSSRQSTQEATTLKPIAPAVPARKKRLAPRPPSQNLSVENNVDLRLKTIEANSQQSEKELYDSTKTNLTIDCNGNTKGSLHNNRNCIDPCQEKSSDVVKKSIEVVSRINSNNNIEITSIQPEPSPRRKPQSPTKKSVPMAPPRCTKSPITTQSEEIEPNNLSTSKLSPMALPRSASSDSLNTHLLEKCNPKSRTAFDIVVNEKPVVEPNSQNHSARSTPVESINSQTKGSVSDDTEEHIDRSWNSSSTQSLETKQKSFIESSSEDDEMIKVYDLKLGKTIVKTLSNHKSVEVLDGIMPNNKIEQNDQLKSTSVELSKPLNFSNGNTLITSGEENVNSPELNSPTVKQLKTVETPEPYEISSDQEIENKIEEPQIVKETHIKHEDLVKKSELNVVVNEKTKTENKNEEKIKIEEHQEKPELSQPNHSIENGKDKQNLTVSNNEVTNSSQGTIKQEPLITTLERLLGDEELIDENEVHLKEPTTIQIKPILHTNQTQTARSSSFLPISQSELNNQRNLTTDEYFNRRRRSSSELSIGESPSLQSLGVIKSILNSRQNSLNGTEESNRSPPTECDIHKMEEPSPKSNNIFTRNKLKETIEKEEKIYRYSGPPNIHFSTWSERPKVEVLIKNEKDCVVVGSKKNSQNTPNNVNKGDLALERNGRNLSSGPTSVELVKGKQTLKENNSHYTNQKEIVVKSQNQSPTSAMPKFILGGRTSNPWPINISNSNTLPHNNRPLSQPPLYRSTSITRISPDSVINQTRTQPAFGQGTLRKTGFKEKIVPSQNTDEVDAEVSKPIPFTLKNQTNPQTTPKITKTLNFRTETTPVSAVPEAPPPPPIIRAVVTKQKINNRTQISLNVDPRDQLLSAIRNFKRDELKNTNIL